ncbi:DsbA family protein [Thalassospira mesophila]|uniref:Membrane protein n=1 Tax=Thalassospira mesophila TaxID=1293891 RepID=A0A1Y2KXS4_9PROT|nr:DsbA family protein [Thalassospira mesophila]OSQ37182.1 membrane protein [Thalassospira mesophila]
MALYILKKAAGCVAIALPLAMMTLSPAHAASDSLSSAQQKQVESMIEGYLMDHPDVLMQALQNVQTWQMSEQTRRQDEAIAPVWKALAGKDSIAPSVGSADAPVTVVEFFDYQCGYCKRAFDDVMAMADDDTRKIRTIFLELPILTPESVVAARAALAAQKQGKYLELHRAMMGSRGKLSNDRIDELAAGAGIDVAQMHKDMDSDDVKKELSRNSGMAKAIGVNGTPAFLINGTLVPGADMERVKSLVDAGLEKDS